MFLGTKNLSGLTSRKETWEVEGKILVQVGVDTNVEGIHVLSRNKEICANLYGVKRHHKIVIPTKDKHEMHLRIVILGFIKSNLSYRTFIVVSSLMDLVGRRHGFFGLSSSWHGIWEHKVC